MICREEMSTLQSPRRGEAEAAVISCFGRLRIGNSAVECSAPVPISSQHLGVVIDYINSYVDEMDDGHAASKPFPPGLSIEDYINLANAADFLILPDLLAATAEQLSRLLHGLLHPSEVLLRMKKEGAIDMATDAPADSFVDIASMADSYRSVLLDSNTPPTAAAILSVEGRLIDLSAKVSGGADIDAAAIELLTNDLWEAWVESVKRYADACDVATDLSGIDDCQWKCLRYISKLPDAVVAKMLRYYRNPTQATDNICGRFIVIRGMGLKSRARDVMLNAIAFVNTFVGMKEYGVSSELSVDALVAMGVEGLRVWLSQQCALIPSGSFLSKTTIAGDLQALGTRGFMLQKQLYDIYYSPKSGRDAYAVHPIEKCSTTRNKAINEAVELLFSPISNSLDVLGNYGGTSKKRRREEPLGVAEAATRALCPEGFRRLLGHLFNKSGWTPADACAAAAKGDLEVLNEIYLSGRESVALHIAHNDTTDPDALPYRKEQDAHCFVRALVAEVGGSLRHASPLVHAVVHGRRDAARWLVDIAGVNPNQRLWCHVENSPDCVCWFSKTALSTVSYSDDTERFPLIASLLLLIQLGATPLESGLEYDPTESFYGFKNFGVEYKVNVRCLELLKDAESALNGEGAYETMADWARRMGNEATYFDWKTNACDPKYRSTIAHEYSADVCDMDTDSDVLEADLRKLPRGVLQAKAIACGMRPHRVNETIISDILICNGLHNRHHDKKRKI